MKRICIGILAHVDAGKTTLCEAMLYRSGALRALGRVDHGDAFLDTQALERERGITIFSKQAIMALDGTELVLLDTPGHVDFSSEMERTLQVLDYAVLLISGTDGVQGHTRTLWGLLRRYQIPTFLFVNKMDLPACDRAALMRELQDAFGEGCVDFSQPREARDEALAVLDDTLTERYLQTGALTDAQITQLIARRRAFACFFGSALKLEGVDELLHGLRDFTRQPERPDAFSARVFKISRDEKGARLTHMKITGGALRVKSLLRGADWEEKCDQLRIYSGEKYQLAETVQAGMVCAATGLSHTLPGDGLGFEAGRSEPVLRPVLEYRVTPQDGTDLREVYSRLRQLQEEDPQLHLSWESATREVRVGLMGEVQREVLQRVIRDRFAMDVAFDEGKIVYLETIAESVEGVGHYEPLRHYAEVHLLLEPGEPGSGLIFDTMCSEDALSRNWQRLVLTHLMEKQHRGVLLGAPLTDVRITLVSGRAHQKHTEGGDFRQATYRAVRQGLRKAKSVLLEPWYDFRLELPQALAGRAMSDVGQMGGECAPPETLGQDALLTGSAPVAKLRGYAREVAAYTRGIGRLTLSAGGYRPCPQQSEIVQASGYDPERDLENPTGSVFCEHGAGFDVRWDEVDAHAHLPLLRLRADAADTAAAPQSVVRGGASGGTAGLDKELQSIFERTYGAIRRRDILPTQTLHAEDKQQLLARLEPAEEYVLVDGYNILFAWDELSAIARDNLDAARHILMNLLCNYQAYRGCALILVFDAYKVPEGLGSVEKYHNIHIVYTKQAETADQYIERVTYALAGRRRRVRVATSDNLEQLIILGHGAERVSAQSFHDEVQAVQAEISRLVQRNNQKNAEL